MPVADAAAIDLVRRAAQGDAAAAEAFLVAFEPLIAAQCRLAYADDLRARRAAQRDTDTWLRTGGFAVLAQFVRGSFEAYVIVRVAEALAERVARMIMSDHPDVWAAFEGIFRPIIARRVKARVPKAEHDEMESAVDLRLAENGFRRLRGYRGDNGGRSFVGYVNSAIDAAITDQWRHEHGRPRPPASVTRMSKLAQVVYRLLYERGYPHDERVLWLLLPSALRAAATVAQTREAMEQVEREVSRLTEGGTPPGPRPASVPLPGPDGTSDDSEGGGAVNVATGTDPEGELIEHEYSRLTQNALQALAQVVASLDKDEWLFIELKLKDAKSEQIAQVMGLPVTAVYTLRTRVFGRLKRLLKDHQAIEIWLAYLHGGEEAKPTAPNAPGKNRLRDKKMRIGSVLPIRRT